MPRIIQKKGDENLCDHGFLTKVQSNVRHPFISIVRILEHIAEKKQDPLNKILFI